MEAIKCEMEAHRCRWKQECTECKGKQSSPSLLSGRHGTYICGEGGGMGMVYTMEEEVYRAHSELVWSE